MKNHIFIVALILALMSCEDDGVNPLEQAILAEQAPRGLFFSITLKEANGNYVVQQRIDSVNLIINGREWGVFSSAPIDTSLIEKAISGDFFVTTTELKYYVAAPFQFSELAEPLTAGDVLEYLQERQVLHPGDHFSQIQGLTLTTSDGNERRVRYFGDSIFEIKQAETSVYIGNFEVTID
jgi:hypothetical protein